MAWGARKNKYNNVVVITEDGKFDSKAELTYWLVLKDREKCGEIYDLERQVRYDFAGIKYPSKRTAKAIWDYRYKDKDGIHVVDKKGGKATQTHVFKLKWAMMLFFYDIEVEIV